MTRMRPFGMRLSGAAQALALVLAFGLTAGLAVPGAAQDQPAPQTAAPQTAAPQTATPDAQAQPKATPPAPGGGLTKSQTAGTSSRTKTLSVLPPNPDSLDYIAWEQLAQRAERATAGGTTSDNGLELIRGQLVDWRAKLQEAQTLNDSRIASLRSQIEALGPVPEGEGGEAAEIAARRAELTDQLQKLEAPRRTAEEAYRRASGLIAEIDGQLRDRKTAQMLRLWPSPANPANWDDAFSAIGTSLWSIGAEARSNWANPAKQAEFFELLPGSGLMLVVALVLVFRGRRWIERFANWLNRSAGSASWRRVWAFVASLGQIFVPTAGVFLMAVAVVITEMPGWLGKEVLLALPGAGLAIFLSHWLAGRIFPRGIEAGATGGPVQLTAQVSAEARVLVTSLGLVQGLELVRESLFPVALVAEEATPVLALPSLLVLAFLLWRFGHLLNRHVGLVADGPEEGSGFRDGVIRFIGKVLIAIAILAPLLAVIGYINLAQGLIFPAAGSLTLAGILLVLVQVIGDIWRAIVGDDEAAQGLLPVLAGFVLTLASLPLFAMIWGARAEDLGELWNRFTQGFMLGETRISPSNFLYLLILFLIGYGATRLFQGALRSSILPKTRLDQGGRNAIISGTGYIGIFLSALIAVSTAGINLSGLAIVASALSVGIGFGLQNIVQNFVSGIILLIERPVSEGDWIEVGNVSGTVQSISVRSTRIQTFDRSDIIVPNADLVSQRVTNWTRFSLTGRVIVPVSVKFGQDTRQISQILREIAEAQPLTLLNPEPSILVVSITADSVNYEMRLLIRDVNFAHNVRSEIYHQVVERFRDAGILLTGTPGSSPSRIEDIATVLEVLQAATPMQLAQIAPARAAKAEAEAAAARLAAGAPDPSQDHAIDTETER